MGGIGQQVADNLFELGKSTAQAVVKTGGDLASGTVEQLVGSPSGVGAPQQGDRPKDQGQMNKEREVEERKRRDNQRYQQVMAELEQFRQFQARVNRQKEEEKLQQEAQQKRQKEAYVKQEKESFVQRMLHKVAGGSHGETDRQKE